MKTSSLNLHLDTGSISSLSPKNLSKVRSLHQLDGGSGNDRRKWVHYLSGSPGHFNQESVFDSAIFGVMGLFILFNTLAVIYMAWLFFRLSTDMPKAYLWGIRLGLVLLIVGSFVGGVMSGLNSHNIGVNMGGDGLPLTNWSTRVATLGLLILLVCMRFRLFLWLVTWCLAMLSLSITSERCFIRCLAPRCMPFLPALYSGRQ